MGGYLVEQIEIESLIILAKEEYPEVKWTNFTETSNEHFAVWGWNEKGTYTVGLAIKHENHETPELEWFIKFISETEGPVIEPPIEFIKTRPKLTSEGSRAIKNAQERRTHIEYIESVRMDASNKGVILSAVSCDENRVFIWTTKGNYYISKSVYDSTKAMLGILTVEDMEKAGVNIIKTIEEKPTFKF